MSAPEGSPPSEALPGGTPGHYTLLLVPEDAGEEVVHLRLSRTALRRGAWLIGLALGGVLVLGLLGVLSLSRLGAHRALVQENLALRGELGEIEAKLDRVESAMRRVQLYDAQLRDALDDGRTRPGGFGPLEPDEAQALGVAVEPGEDRVLADGEPMDDLGLEVPVEDLRPAEAWALAVQARTDDFLRRLQRLEPRLGLLAEDVQDYLTLNAAFPSVWPVDGVLTSGFGYRRSPINNTWKFHSGVDLSAPKGALVSAAAPGVVTLAQFNAGYGRMIVIDHGYGIESRYAHNSSLFVKEGDWVDAGQIIATVGMTGQTTGPHLHFELMIDGEAVDPLEYLPD